MFCSTLISSTVQLDLPLSLSTNRSGRTTTFFVHFGSAISVTESENDLWVNATLKITACKAMNPQRALQPRQYVGFSVCLK